MGFVIWYQVRFPGLGPGGLLPLRISNDVLSGEYVLDADITLKMPSGPVAGEFQIVFTNLPGGVTQALEDQQVKQALSLPGVPLPGAAATREPLECHIALGYFDDAPVLTGPSPVMVGAVTGIKATVGPDGLPRTEVRGVELTGYKLQHRPVSHDCDRTLHLAKLAEGIAKDAGVTIVGQADLGRARRPYAVSSTNGLDALREITSQSEISRKAGKAIAVVVRDGQIRLGSKVGDAADGKIDLSEVTNLVKVEKFQVTEKALDPGKPLEQRTVTYTTRIYYEVTSLGIPAFRAGKAVRLDTADAPGNLRVDSVVHRFSTYAGYTCEATLVVAKAGEAVDALGGAQALVDSMADFADKAPERRPAIDVGEVAEYQSGPRHRATLNYGQSPADGTVAPSVQTAVDSGTRLRSTPMASPFAWHGCGLMVPVYEGMRALLAHNRSLTNDALVAGFIWAEEPSMDPPANHPGDYWLCLPTSVVAGKPAGKGVNDLTDKAGRRVIQAQGLRIEVGDALLPNVGARPTVPDDLAGTIVIEHQGGTTITVESSGSVTIKTSGSDIVMSNGAATLTLSGPTVKVS
jgi:hypothetical protein